MSINYSIKCNGISDDWPVGNCIDAASYLAENGHRGALKALALEPEVELGRKHTLDRQLMLAALDKLAPIARQIPQSFQIQFESGPGRGMGGLKIGGIYYWIMSWRSYWTIAPQEKQVIPPGTEVPIGMRGEHRRDTAEFKTENFGVIKVVSKKGRRSHMATLLSQIREFVESANDDKFVVTIV